MDSPFRSWYEGPAQQRRSKSYNPSLFRVPVHPVDPTGQSLHRSYSDGQPPVEKKSGRKVVQIPVQFFGSDIDRRSKSALRIQNVFRGFFVRKSVRKIKEIKGQVDEIEARLLRDDVVEMIRGNERERLRMIESLMNLLLRLDGIRGFDSGIRICRKGVTSKAIALQEKIDAICAPATEVIVDDKVEIGSQVLEDGVPASEFVGIELSPENGEAVEFEGSRLEENSENAKDSQQILCRLGDESKELTTSPLGCEKMEVERDSALTVGLDTVVASEVNLSDETHVEAETTWKNIDEDNVDSMKEMSVRGKDMINAGVKEDDAIGNCEFLVNSGVPVTSVVEGTPRKSLDLDEGDVETVKEMLAYSDNRGEKLCYLSEESLGGHETMEVERKDLDVPVAVVTDFGVERKEGWVERNGKDMGVTEKEERKCEVLEQLMEENKKMMHTMTQLYERNEMQLHMLDALANRVELLEKSYLCDKLRGRRKKINKCGLNCLED